MSTAQQIEGRGKVVGNRARLGAAIYGRNANGAWRRLAEQDAAWRQFSRAEAQADRDCRRAA